MALILDFLQGPSVDFAEKLFKCAVLRARRPRAISLDASFWQDLGQRKPRCASVRDAKNLPWQKSEGEAGRTCNEVGKCNVTLVFWLTDFDASSMRFIFIYSALILLLLCLETRTLVSDGKAVTWVLPMGCVKKHKSSRNLGRNSETSTKSLYESKGRKDEQASNRIAGRSR